MLANGASAPERQIELRLAGTDGEVRPIITLHDTGLYAFEPIVHPDIGMAVKVSVYCENVSLSLAGLSG